MRRGFTGFYSKLILSVYILMSFDFPFVRCKIPTDRSYFTSPFLNASYILYQNKPQLLLDKNLWSISSGIHGHTGV